MIVESLGLAYASLFIGFPIRVKIARRPTLGAQLLGSSLNNCLIGEWLQNES